MARGFKEVRTAISNVVVQNLTLGDIDKDGYPDVLLTVKPAGEVLTLLNVADGGEGTGRLTGPVGTGGHSRCWWCANAGWTRQQSCGASADLARSDERFTSGYSLCGRQRHHAVIPGARRFSLRFRL